MLFVYDGHLDDATAG